MTTEPANLVVSHLCAPDGTGHTVALEGELDYLTAPDYISILDEITFTPGAVVELDLAGVPFCDSAGLAALLETYDRVRKTGGVLRVAAIDPHLLRTLEMTGVAHLFVSA